MASKTEQLRRTVEDQRKSILVALRMAEQYGGIDGDHHKTWVIDQIVRALTGSSYKEWVTAARAGRQISMCARYLAIVQNRPFSEMRKTNEGRQAC